MRAANVLPDACQTYHQQVQTLRSAALWHDTDVLAMLRKRDRLQHLIDQLSKQPDPPALSPQIWVDLANDDHQVEQWNDRLLALDALPKWRTSLNPPESHWWWYPKAQEQKPVLGWLWNGLTIALLTVTLALAKDIATRFFTGAPGIWSSIGAIVPVVLTLLATGGALTQVGQQMIEAVLTRRGNAKRNWPLIKSVLALVVAILLFWGHSAGLPWAAQKYHAIGSEQYYKHGQLTSARTSFERALALKPDFPAANHDLGVTSEDLRDFKQAKAEYSKALKAGYLQSANNFARLLIVKDQDYESAAVMLKSALDIYRQREPDPELEYGLRKNLGWAWLKQHRWVEAKGRLLEAIELEDEVEGDRPDAHCLLAQVLTAEYTQAKTDAEADAKKNNKNDEPIRVENAEAMLAAINAKWDTCRRHIRRPEDDVWKAMANKGLLTIKKEQAHEAAATPTH